jgi:hypothetical protein
MIRLAVFFICFAGYGQQMKFKVYSDLQHGFSFDIPDNWLIRADTSFEHSIAICDSTVDDEIESYRFCDEGIIFRIEHFKSDLDNTLISSGLYEKTPDGYVTSDRINNHVLVESIKGKNWTGAYHSNVCGVMCIDEETKEKEFHAVAGQCDNLYFSNGEETICISTNGSSFDEVVFNRLVASFKFGR